MRLALSFIFLLCICTALCSETIPEWGMGVEDNETIIVTLPKENPLRAIYVTELFTRSKSVSINADLEKIIRFDFSHSGVTDLLAKDPHYEQLVRQALSQGKAIPPRDASTIVIAPQWIDNQLNYQLYLPRASKKHIALVGPALSDELVDDREAIHTFNDRVLEEYFGGYAWANARLIYTLRKREGDGSYSSEIWCMDRDGNNNRQITTKGGYCVTPFVVAGGDPSHPRFFYVSYKKGEPRIYYADVGSQKVTPSLTLRGNQLMPAFSERAGLLALICDVSGNPDLFVQPYSLEGGAVGAPRQLFTAKQATQGSPTFNPEGTELAFVSNKDGSPKIYRLALNTSGKPQPKLVSVRAKNGTAPAWSPDGKKIAFCSRTAGFRQIWIADLKTGEEYPITEGKGHKENPTWAPDSLHLVYNTADPDHCELFLIDCIRRTPKRLSTGTGEKRFPSFWAR